MSVLEAKLREQQEQKRPAEEIGGAREAEARREGRADSRALSGVRDSWVRLGNPFLDLYVGWCCF